MMAIPIATIASPHSGPRLRRAAGAFSKKMVWLPLPATSQGRPLDEKKTNAATASRVRIQARKVRSFAAWFV